MKSRQILIDQVYVREAFDYDPLSGIATWKLRPRHHFATDWAHNITNTKYAGRPCGAHSGGYIKTKLGGSGYRIHRLVWLWMHGRIPKLLDHINGDRTDNRLCNLREATNSQNQQNTAKRANTSSKLKGVMWHPKSMRWHSRITHHTRRYYLGFFSTEQEAHEAYCVKGRELFGEFFNPGC